MRRTDLSQAGICPDIEMLKVGESLSKTINVTMATNVAGAAQTAETFLPLLKKAQNPRIVFMSSGLGSVTRYATPSDYNMWPAYASSKAALNMMMLWFWRRFPDMKINSCCPGFRVSHLSEYGISRDVTDRIIIVNLFKPLRYRCSRRLGSRQSRRCNGKCRPFDFAW